MDLSIHERLECLMVQHMQTNISFNGKPDPTKASNLVTLDKSYVSNFLTLTINTVNLTCLE